MSIFTVINNIEEYAKQINKYDQSRELIECIAVSHILYGTIRRIMNIEAFKEEDVMKCINFVISKYPLWDQNSLVKLYLKKELSFINSLRKKYSF